MTEQDIAIIEMTIGFCVMLAWLLYKTRKGE